MVEIKSAIILTDETNPWIDMCITVGAYENLEEIQELATNALSSWHEEETDEPIGDYVKRKLSEQGHEPQIYFGDFNSDEDDYDF